MWITSVSRLFRCQNLHEIRAFRGHFSQNLSRVAAFAEIAQRLVTGVRADFEHGSSPCQIEHLPTALQFRRAERTSLRPLPLSRPRHVAPLTLHIPVAAPSSRSGRAHPARDAVPASRKRPTGISLPTAHRPFTAPFHSKTRSTPIELNRGRSGDTDHAEST